MMGTLKKILSQTENKPIEVTRSGNHLAIEIDDRLYIFSEDAEKDDSFDKLIRV